MKKIRLTALAIVVAVGAVAVSKARPAATAFHFIPTGIAESATAYKNPANWQLAPVTCGGANNLACRVVSQTATTPAQLVAEIEASSGTAAGEVAYTRSLAQSFKP